MIYQKCRHCNGVGGYEAPDPRTGGATSFLEQCPACQDGDVFVDIDRLMQHDHYLDHLISQVPTCEEAGCEPAENAHDEMCVVGSVLYDLRYFLSTVKSNNGDCSYDPMELCDKPIGQYHCPECGMMVVACLPHP